MSLAAGSAGARHEAVLYSSADQLASLLGPRVQGALDAGDPVVAVLDATNRAALGAALGADADGVEFQDPADVHTVPAFTVATRWARVSRRVTRPGRRATVIGQHVDGLPDCGPEHWARLDIALNVAIDGLPITVLCPYPSGARELARVHSTHPLLLTGEGPRRSESYRPPHDSLVEYPPPPPPELGPPTAAMDFDATDLAVLRQLVAAVAGGAGLLADRVADLVLAVNEIASNSIEHGAGDGRVQLWTTAAAVVAEIADSGRMSLPFPGMTAPPPSGSRGRGLWLAGELSDVLQVWSDGHPAGTVTRLEITR